MPASARGGAGHSRPVAVRKPLRALDAIHLATFVLARRTIPDLEMLTADERLRDAVAGG